MAGIFLLYPRLEAWYPAGPRIDPLRRIWQAAALSISCQVFTGPLAWYRFHTFPPYFLLTNLLALPLTTILMGTAVATLLLQGLGCCPGFLLHATDALARTLVWMLGIISSM
jgi:competence protein ComEC